MDNFKVTRKANLAHRHRAAVEVWKAGIPVAPEVTIPLVTIGKGSARGQSRLLTLAALLFPRSQQV